ncbi:MULTISPECIES: hypothetical protein [Pseudomonas syringae group]|uniref:hypothetical protein n=1 Tax=Pseudomonas syringae group TaxID=136849 RepID=UPI0009426300|nr:MULTISPECIES: hypothetical protein [Pseudomonas syringae group]
MGCISSKPQVASPSNHSFSGNSEASYSGTARAESSQRRPLRYGELPGPPAHSNLTYYQQSLVGVDCPSRCRHLILASNKKPECIRRSLKA